MRETYSVIIVAYEYSPATLKKALSCHLQSQLSPHRIVVIDSASPCDLYRYLHLEFPTVEFIRCPRNFGYAAGANWGIEIVNNEFVFLCNVDLFVYPLTTEHLIEATLNYSSPVAVCGPTLLYGDGSLQPSWRKFPDKSLLHTWLNGNLSHLSMQSEFSLKESFMREAIPVDWVMGCGMMVRKVAWQRVGGIDEKYFLYFEDIDFQKRLTNDGWSIIACPKAIAEHVWARKNRTTLSHRILWSRSSLRYCLIHKLPII